VIGGWGPLATTFEHLHVRKHAIRRKANHSTVFNRKQRTCQTDTLAENLPRLLTGDYLGEAIGTLIQNECHSMFVLVVLLQIVSPPSCKNYLVSWIKH
jgi:hypothetical protein